MREPFVLAVDDTPQNLRLLEAVLAPRGYRVAGATSGLEALAAIEADPPDLVLLDVLMPGMDGYAVCRAIRANPTSSFLPVVMITASGEQEKINAIEAGADDFIPKPFNQAELLARVKSLVRIKRYQDEIAEWNRTLEDRVAAQVEQIERLGRLRRFLSPPIADLVASGGEAVLRSQRRQVAVVFCDLRGSTAFSENAEPEEALEILAAYHDAMGRIVTEYEGTIEHRAGDGLLVLFNAPLDCPDPAERAVAMAVTMRTRMDELCADWRRRGHELGFGAGVSLGYATLGLVGHEGRYDYTANGSVVVLAARLSAEALAGQILVSQRVAGVLGDALESEAIGELQLKGFPRPVAAYNVITLKSPTTVGG